MLGRMQKPPRRGYGCPAGGVLIKTAREGLRSPGCWGAHGNRPGRVAVTWEGLELLGWVGRCLWGG